MTAQRLEVNHNSLSIVEPELKLALQKAMDQLDVLADQPGNENLAEQFSTALQEIAGIFRMVELGAAYQLANAINESMQKLIDAGQPASTRKKEALFAALYMLPRYFEFALAEKVANPLLLAPAFYSLSSAGLSPFTPESQLLGFEVTPRPIIPGRIFSSAGDWEGIEAKNGSSLTFRRLRHMYQLGLVGLLRNESTQSSLSMIGRAVDRCISLCEDTRQAPVWRLLKAYLEVVESGALELSPQRRHFFARFDRCLKALEQQHYQAVNELPDQSVLNELVLLVLLGRPEEAEQAYLCEFIEPVTIDMRDEELSRQRQLMERSTLEALDTLLESVQSELASAVKVLDTMAESGICEPSDIDLLTLRCKTMQEALRVGGFAKEAESLKDAISIFSSWLGHAPDVEEMLQVANIFLYLESALANRLAPAAGSEDEKAVVSRGLLHQAKDILYTESRATLSLSKRAVTSYIESNFDREHIANVSQCLAVVRGAFNMINLDNAANLIQRCEEKIEGEYENSGDHSVELLETLADALVTAEFLLEELQAGRNISSQLDSLLVSNYEALA